MSRGPSQRGRQADENQQSHNCFQPSSHLRQHIIDKVTLKAVCQEGPLWILGKS